MNPSMPVTHGLSKISLESIDYGFESDSSLAIYDTGIADERDERSVDLWNRTFNRDSGKALFDMFVNTNFSSFGIGFLRFNDIGFLGIDILRLNFLKNDSVTIVEKWETWSDLSGSRYRLDENILERSEKWKRILHSPTGFLITVGINF